MALRLPAFVTPIKINNITSALQKVWGKEECETRCKLATAYRLTHYFGWDDLIYGHISTKIPDTNHFLINAFGMHFAEVTASSLMKIDIEGNVINRGTSEFEFQRTGYIIHSAIHEARPDLHTLMHVHTREGMAVSTAVDKLLPILQPSIMIEPVSYHDYHGIVVDEAEKKALVESFLAPSKCLLMRNHGLMSGGRSVEEAFFRMYFFHQVCTAYMDLGYTQNPAPPEKLFSPEMIKRSIEANRKMTKRDDGLGNLEFAALSRQLDNAGMETGYPYANIN